MYLSRSLPSVHMQQRVGETPTKAFYSGKLLQCWQYAVVGLKMRTGQISHSKQFIQQTYCHCFYSGVVQKQVANLSNVVTGDGKNMNNLL